MSLFSVYKKGDAITEKVRRTREGDGRHLAGATTGQKNGLGTRKSTAQEGK